MTELEVFYTDDIQGERDGAVRESPNAVVSRTLVGPLGEKGLIRVFGSTLICCDRRVVVRFGWYRKTHCIGR